jgi:hypothetical protein
MMTILSCIPAAVAALLGFDASFLVVANSLPSRCVRLGVCPREGPHFISPDRGNADPLAVLQIGFASDGDHARRGLLRISAYGQARKHNI